MITIQIWNHATNTVEARDPSALTAERDALLITKDVVWIDLQQPTAEEEQLVLQQFFTVHSLTLEDITRLRRKPGAPHLPKVEEFPDYLFVIVNPLTREFQRHIGKPVERPDGSARPFTQLSIILTQHMLITHHGDPMGCTDQLQAYLQRHGAQAHRGPDYLCHLILDHTVDEYVPVLDYINDNLEHLETHVLQKPRPTLFQRMLRLKREIILLRKTLIHEREVLVRLSRGEFALVDEREMVYYRNVYDHLVRFTELIESSREMASDILQTYLAATSNRLSQIMKVLTMISTIVLPMTLISGIYGMNFENSEWPDFHATWGFQFAIALMLVSGMVSLLLFYWRKWL
ncbi:MAG: magnesium/cobalt transporter CorA [Gemmataceae bacterium]|nr:magnesium/cobalt transporter CorA [Gemmataceae bacterium]